MNHFAPGGAWEREWERSEKRAHPDRVLASCPLCLSKLLLPSDQVLRFAPDAISFSTMDIVTVPARVAIVHCDGRGNRHTYRRMP